MQAIPVLSYPFTRVPRRRCRTLAWQQTPLTLAAMTFALLLMQRGLDPASAVALSAALVASSSRPGSRRNPPRRRSEGRRR